MGKRISKRRTKPDPPALPVTLLQSKDGRYFLVGDRRNEPLRTIWPPPQPPPPEAARMLTPTEKEILRLLRELGAPLTSQQIAVKIGVESETVRRLLRPKFPLRHWGAVLRVKKGYASADIPPTPDGEIIDKLLKRLASRPTPTDDEIMAFLKKNYF